MCEAGRTDALLRTEVTIPAGRAKEFHMNGCGIGARKFVRVHACTLLCALVFVYAFERVHW